MSDKESETSSKNLESRKTDLAASTAVTNPDEADAKKSQLQCFQGMELHPHLKWHRWRMKIQHF